MLAAPGIGGVVAACYKDTDNKIIITVPYVLDRSVSPIELSGFSIKIKNLQGTRYIATGIGEARLDTNEVIFELGNGSIVNQFVVGNTYKLQIACIDKNGETGYYSNVATIKYTAKPTLTVEYNNKTLIGTYKNMEDKSERVYQYCFSFDKLKGKGVDNKDIIETDTTGWLLHDASTDQEIGMSYDTFEYTGLDPLKKISYKVKTINGLEEDIGNSDLPQVTNENLPSPFGLCVSSNRENGYNDIATNLQFKTTGIIGDTEYSIYINGQNEFIYKDNAFQSVGKDEQGDYVLGNKISYFRLLRFDPQDNKWIILVDDIAANKNGYFYKDFNVESGVKYTYCLQAKNEGYIPVPGSDDGEAATTYFDHIYLCDLNPEGRQLKISFNPKISSFKRTLLEQKVDTIGSKYPFIFRNGAVDYKEFPISGLLSYEMDDEGLFDSKYNSFWNMEVDHTYKYIPYTFGLPDYAFSDTGWIDILYKNTAKKNYINDLNNLYVKENEQLVLWSEYAQNNTELNSNILTNAEEWFNYYRRPGRIEYFLRINVIENFEEYDETKHNIKPNSLTAKNANIEKEFKLEVLDWLTNGEPKLFKSPKEGNYIVRLMNVSLSPNDTLGRMIHTFSTTAYEIGDTKDIVIVKGGINDEQTV